MMDMIYNNMPSIDYSKLRESDDKFYLTGLFQNIRPRPLILLQDDTFTKLYSI